MQAPNYECSIGGPILVTAAHSAALYRGGPDYGEKPRLHQREYYTSIIALRVAHYLKTDLKTHASFCVWSKSHTLKDNDLDPNYLIKKNAALSPFHRALHLFKAGFKGQPVLHVDIHGKLTRKDNCEIELGTEPMNQLWEQSQLRRGIMKVFAQGVDKMLDGVKFGKFKQRCNVDPALHGFWGAGIMTMTDQAIRLGIPSFQLQIPIQVRRLFFRQPQYCKGLAAVIAKVYSEVVVPWFVATKGERVDSAIEPDLCKHVSVLAQPKLDQLIKAYQEWQTKNVKENKKGI